METLCCAMFGFAVSLFAVGRTAGDGGNCCFFAIEGRWERADMARGGVDDNELSEATNEFSP